MFPENDTPKTNRRGCYILLACVVVALILFALLASRTADTAAFNESISEIGGAANR
jgi:hypothetical protein